MSYTAKTWWEYAVSEQLKGEMVAKYYPNYRYKLTTLANECISMMYENEIVNQAELTPGLIKVLTALVYYSQINTVTGVRPVDEYSHEEAWRMAQALLWEGSQLIEGKYRPKLPYTLDKFAIETPEYDVYVHVWIDRLTAPTLFSYNKGLKVPIDSTVWNEVNAYIDSIIKSYAIKSEITFSFSASTQDKANLKPTHKYNPEHLAVVLSALDEYGFKIGELVKVIDSGSRYYLHEGTVTSSITTEAVVRLKEASSQTFKTAQLERVTPPPTPNSSEIPQRIKPGDYIQVIGSSYSGKRGIVGKVYEDKEEVDVMLDGVNRVLTVPLSALRIRKRSLTEELMGLDGIKADRFQRIEKLDKLPIDEFNILANKLTTIGKLDLAKWLIKSTPISAISAIRDTIKSLGINL